MATDGTYKGVTGTAFGSGGSTFGGRSGCPAPCVAALAVVVLGLVAALAAAQWTQVRNGRTAAERFQVVATRVASLVEGRMARYEYAVRGARGAVAAAGEAGITRDGFHRYAVKVMSVVDWSPDTVWMIMSTLMLASASGPKIAAAMPGLSLTARSVIWASSLAKAMPVMVCCSTI